MSGIGFGLGVDRTLLALEAENIAAAPDSRVDVFGVPLGEAALDKLVEVAAQLRGEGVRVDLAYGGKGLKGAMKSADRSGAVFALVLGERELAEGQVELKDLNTGDQQSIPLASAASVIRERLGR